MLAGVTMSGGEQAALLDQIGKETRSQLGGSCKICDGWVELGSEIAKSRKYGWSHKACLDEERARQTQ